MNVFKNRGGEDRFALGLFLRRLVESHSPAADKKRLEENKYGLRNLSQRHKLGSVPLPCFFLTRDLFFFDSAIVN